MGKIHDLKGQRFGRLIVKEFAGLNKHRKATWDCLCDCGKKVIVVGTSLINGSTTSCGCYALKSKQERFKKHGLRNHDLYKTWLNIKARCYNPKNNHYKYYGERGIKMCDEWKDNFENFFNWAINNGWQRMLSIERIDNEKWYEPSNCKWIKMCAQSKNRRTNHYLVDEKGNKVTIADVSRSTNINARSLYSCYSKYKTILPTLHLHGVFSYKEIDNQK